VFQRWNLEISHFIFNFDVVVVGVVVAGVGVVAGVAGVGVVVVFVVAAVDVVVVGLLLLFAF